MRDIAAALALVATAFLLPASASDASYDSDLTRRAKLRRAGRLQPRASSTPSSNLVLPADGAFLVCPPTYTFNDQTVDLLYSEITYSHGDPGTLSCTYPAEAGKPVIPVCQYSIFDGKDANFWGINDLGCAQTSSTHTLAFEHCFTTCHGPNLLGVDIYTGGDARITGCLLNDDFETPCDFGTVDGAVFNTDSKGCEHVTISRGTCVQGY